METLALSWNDEISTLLYSKHHSNMYNNASKGRMKVRTYHACIYGT